MTGERGFAGYGLLFGGLLVLIGVICAGWWFPDRTGSERIGIGVLIALVLQLLCEIVRFSMKRIRRIN